MLSRASHAHPATRPAAAGPTHVQDVPHVDGRQVVLLGAILQGAVEHVVHLQVIGQSPFSLTPSVAFPLGPLFLFLPFLTFFIVLLFCKCTKNVTRISKTAPRT